MKKAIRFATAGACLLVGPGAQAHGFEERYDLPVPLSFFIAGACGTVLLTFLIAVVFARSQHSQAGLNRLDPEPDQAGLHIPEAWHWIARGLGLLVFALCCVAAQFGTRDPLMNFAPTLVWIIWWIGLSLLVAFVGNIWPALDPWGTLFEIADGLARRLGRPEGISLGWHWPDRVGAWPAVGLLLLWCWLEVVYPLASSPGQVALAIAIWSVFNLAGMAGFGRETWQRHVDVFALYFKLLGLLAPLWFDKECRRLKRRRPGSGLLQAGAIKTLGEVGFVVAMLSTVLFDGLHGGQTWLQFKAGLQQLFPRWMDINGYFEGTVGLILVWSGMLLAYLATAWLTSHWLAVGTGSDRASLFAPTLIPIAVGYNIAHNISSLVLQGQNIVPLLSDPLGRQWNLLGTADYRTDIGLIDAGTTWYVAIVAIVGAHVLATWQAHRLALREYPTSRLASQASLPLTVLMVGYTAVSLLAIAEPMIA